MWKLDRRTSTTSTSSWSWLVLCPVGHSLYSVLVACLCLPGASCALLDFGEPEEAELSAVEIEEIPAAKKEPMSLFELQSDLMGFADAFVVGLRHEINALCEELGAQANDLNRWKVTQSSHAVILAGGPNSVVNMLDLTGLATLARMAVEDYWIPEVLGKSGRKLLDFHRRYEDEIWEIVREVISPEKQDQLMKIIREWRTAHPSQRIASFVSIADYAKDRWRTPGVAAGSSRNLLTMLSIDPLSSLDPAAREIAQTRYTAERIIYFLQRAPALVRMNSELLVLDLTSRNPEVSRLVDDISAFRTNAADFVRAVDELPAKIAREQRRFVAEIAAQKDDLSALVNEFQLAFVAGSKMADSIDQGVQTLDGFISGLRDDAESAPDVTAAGTPQPASARAPATAPTSESRRFDVLDYAKAAEDISRASRNLDATIRSLEKLIATPAWQDRQREMKSLVAEVEAGVDRVSGRLFVRGLIFLGVFLTGGVVAMLIYRVIARRLQHANRV